MNYPKIAATKAALIASVATLAIYTSAVFALDFTINWTAPTLREDGTSLVSSDIASYEIWSSPKAGGPYTLSATVPGSVLSGVDRNLTTSVCHVVKTVDQDGLRSAFSNEKCKSVSPPKPPVL